MMEKKTEERSLDKYLGDLYRDEHYKSLSKLSDRDLCEMLRAHFESHPALSGEKWMKDRANLALDNVEKVSDTMKAYMEEMEDICLIPSQKDRDRLNRQFADTRIRETPFLKEGFYPDQLKREPVCRVSDLHGTIYMDKVDARLYRDGDKNIVVMAEGMEGGMHNVGMLPESFLANNPMNVDSCEARIQLIDYSNGKMKNVKALIVVDIDLMSGDVLDLDESMLESLEERSGLQQ